MKNRPEELLEYMEKIDYLNNLEKLNFELKNKYNIDL